MYSIQKFRHYLLGSKFPVITDHKPLKHLFTSEMRNSRIQRWAIILDEHGYDVQHIKGSDNLLADGLSRIGSTEENVADESCSQSPANYACQIEEDDNVQNGDITESKSSKGEVNVIDSNLAPGVQSQSEVEECEVQDQRSKEKFAELLENHPDFHTETMYEVRAKSSRTVFAKTNTLSSDLVHWDHPRSTPPVSR